MSTEREREREREDRTPITGKGLKWIRSASIVQQMSIGVSHPPFSGGYII